MLALSSLFYSFPHGIELFVRPLRRFGEQTDDDRYQEPRREPGDHLIKIVKVRLQDYHPDHGSEKSSQHPGDGAGLGSPFPKERAQDDGRESGAKARPREERITQTAWIPTM